MTTALYIDPHSGAPVYRQIHRQIALAIADRDIEPGQRLAPEDELATQLVVSPSAVHKAYRELVAAGLCDRLQDGGYRVTDPGLGLICAGRSDLVRSLLERELLTRELESARDLQQRLLPPGEIAGESWNVSARCYPAGALAGDFYEVLRHTNGAVDLVVGDVAGKGLAAGLIMAVAKSLLPLASRESSPGEALDLLNEHLARYLNRREFVALAFARFEPSTGSLQLANAGLPDPVLLGADGRIRWLEVAGPRLPLGVRRPSGYATACFSLAPGDRLLLLTDGIPEAMDRKGSPLGYDGLREILQRSSGDSRSLAGGGSGAWLDRLLEAASRRTGSILGDDWTALLLSVHPRDGGPPCSS